MSSRPIIVAGNWKMHKGIADSVAFIKDLAQKVSPLRGHIYIAPPFTALADAARAAEGTPIVIGAQNMSAYDAGAYTGDVSGEMIKDAGAKFVLIGHSERRTVFRESEQLIHKKFLRALILGLNPILCIGENLAQREEGSAEKVLARQIDSALSGLEDAKLKPLIIAYEPVWAIGTGKSATPEMAQDTHHFIRSHLNKKRNASIAESTPILYGGSVKPENSAELMAQPDIDGSLVGGASLEVESFAAIITKGQES